MGRPEVHRSIAVGEAKRLWKLYGFSSPQELVVEDLALALGVVVVEGRLDSAEARLVRSGKKGLIRIRHDIPQAGRKRFAIAHELGHWRMHASVSQLLACTSEDLRADYSGSAPEIEANIFASELLMPEDLFGASIKGTVPSPDVVNTLAAEYFTTRTATAIRFAELSRDYCVTIVSKAGRIRWWRASAEFADSIWIESGRPVSARSLAGQFYAGERPAAEVQQIDMQEWADRFPEFASTVTESAIPLGQTGSVITTLWLE